LPAPAGDYRHSAPSDDSSSPVQSGREAKSTCNRSPSRKLPNQAVPLPPITNTPTVSDADQMAPVAPEPIQDEPVDQGKASLSQPHQQQQQSAPGIEQQWRTYRIERAKPWPSCSAIIICRQPTSMRWRRLKAGQTAQFAADRQTVQIRQNANGVVTGLTIDTGGGQQVLFTRQSNGSFIRAR
jgi:cell envelope opacity-associated protein A